MSPPLLIISISSSPGRPKGETNSPFAFTGTFREAEKRKGCHVWDKPHSQDLQACRTSLPSTGQPERQKCGRKERFWASPPFPAVPAVPGVRVLSASAVPGVQGEPPSWHHGGQAARSPLEGLLCSLLQQLGTASAWTRLPLAARDLPGPRHQTRPLAVPRDFPTEAELDWHAILKDSQTSYQAITSCFLLQESKDLVLVTATQITSQKYAHICSGMCVWFLYLNVTINQYWTFLLQALQYPIYFVKNDYIPSSEN